MNNFRSSLYIMYIISQHEFLLNSQNSRFIDANPQCAFTYADFLEFQQIVLKVCHKNRCFSHNTST